MNAKPRWILTAYVSDREKFNAYWYGYGKIIGEGFWHKPNGAWGLAVEVDYEEDKYHADYQDGRFGSGLIPTKLVNIHAEEDVR